MPRLYEEKEYIYQDEMMYSVFFLFLESAMVTALTRVRCRCLTAWESVVRGYARTSATPKE